MFSEKVPAGIHTAATIMGFMLKHETQEDALENVDILKVFQSLAGNTPQQLTRATPPLLRPISNYATNELLSNSNPSAAHSLSCTQFCRLQATLPSHHCQTLFVWSARRVLPLRTHTNSRRYKRKLFDVHNYTEGRRLSN